MSDVLDLHELAALFAVSESAVRGWITAGLPVAEHGTRGGARKRTRVSLRAATEWYFRKNHERLELDRARTRLANEQADKILLENTARERDLGERAVWDREVESFIAVMRSDLKRFPAIAGQLSGTIEQRRDILETVVSGMLNKWALGA